MQANTIIHGDCMEVMRDMPDASIKCVVTSPPYNMNIGGYGKRDDCDKLHNTKFAFVKYTNHDDNMPRADYLKWMRAALSEMMRLLRDDGAIFFNHKNFINNGLMIDNGEIVRGMNRVCDVWRIVPSKGAMHPATFPIELPIRCIKAAVAERDDDSIVLDPFMGSGTTAVAAERLGVKWIGIEKSEEYVRMARGKIEAERSQMKLNL